jgi:hypothetical protein
LRDNTVSVTKKPKTVAAPSSDTPIDIVVRRGALRRFDKLKEKAAGLPVRLSWDRRVGNRRAAATASPVTSDRRRTDRRKSPPFTWDAADFVVVGDQTPPANGDGAATASKRRRG